MALWGVDRAAIAGWSGISFGQRASGAGAVAAGVIIGTAAGYIATPLAEEIWRRDD